LKGSSPKTTLSAGGCKIHQDTKLAFGNISVNATFQSGYAQRLSVQACKYLI